jgi:Late exocytosis, associated with Golgi transport
MPVHLNGGGLNNNQYDAQSLAFSKFTIANLRQARDPHNHNPGIYWLHLVLAFVFVFYTMYLIHYHYEVRLASNCLLLTF